MPQRIKKAFTGICVSLLAWCFQANAYQQCSSIPQGLDAILKNIKPSVSVGVIVQSMSTGQIYYSKNASTFFAPASVQKIFTVSSALLQLTPEYRFPTRLLTTGTINNGILNGNVIVQFNGDPSLTQTDVIDLLNQLKIHGIYRINGNIIIDNTAYDHIPYPAGWSFDDLTTLK